MFPCLPVCCDKGSFETLSRIVAVIETPDALIDAAVTIALHYDGPLRSGDNCRRHLSAMAGTILSRVHGRQPQALLAHLHGYLFDELGYHGNATDYYDPANGFLPAVLETRTGLPITLSLVYKALADQIGLTSWGIGLPGHFIVGLTVDDKPMWIDPYASGKLMTPEEARSRVATQFGETMQWTQRLAEPVSNRYWITRILQNLLTAYGRIGRYEEMASALEMEVLLWPGETRLHRDLAVVMARIGRGDVASRWLDHYLAQHPNDPQNTDLRHLLESLA